MKQITLVVAMLLTILPLATAAQNIATTRDAAIDIEPEPMKMSRVENRDIKRKRAYPMQPPTIPHKTDDYQVDLNVNKCLSCHSRRRSEASQAPMISVTHYQDRDGNFLADVSPRRYFCQQCHVTQQERAPLLANDFVDIDELLRSGAKQ
jgi:cytochrome c-type protein NapB